MHYDKDFYNASMLPDPTAYKAIKNTEGDIKMAICRSNVYDFTFGNGVKNLVLIMSIDEDNEEGTDAFISGIVLSEKPFNDSITVEHEPSTLYPGKYYADPSRVQFINKPSIGAYRFKILDESMHLLEEKVADHLGIKVKYTAPVQVVNAPDSSTLIKVEAERDIYKQLYTDLIKKMMDEVI